MFMRFANAPLPRRSMLGVQTTAIAPAFFGWFKIQLQLPGRFQSRQHCIDSNTLRVHQVEVVRAVNAGKRGAPSLCQIWHLGRRIFQLFCDVWLFVVSTEFGRGPGVFGPRQCQSCFKARPQL